MPTIASALGDPMPPKPKLVHLALTKLGEGTHKPADVAAVLGHPPRGKYLSIVIAGAKWLRVRGYVEKATSHEIIATDRYSKQRKAES